MLPDVQLRSWRKRFDTFRTKVYVFESDPFPLQGGLVLPGNVAYSLDWDGKRLDPAGAGNWRRTGEIVLRKSLPQKVREHLTAQGYAIA
jgi:hypothetical protein